MSASTSSQCAAVHPRACGEHAIDAKRWVEQGGSSPRLRGTSCFGPSRPRLVWFIPAPAGNMERRAPNVQTAPVHPRACGEHRSLLCVRFARNGSSPRLRGTCPHTRQNTANTRFIPAPAGNMTTLRLTAGATTVHPRACGEHDKTKARLNIAAGSSPRLRGTSDWKGSLKAGTRFIPAPAGNMHGGPAPADPHPVHPRACGEHPLW